MRQDRPKWNGLCSNIIFEHIAYCALTGQLRNFIVLLALTVAAGTVGNLLSSGNELEKLRENAESIQQSISEMDTELQQVLSRIKEDDVELNSFRSLWNEKRIGLIVYQDNRAVHWTTNVIPFKESFDDRHRPSDGIVHLIHSWYLCRTIEHDGQLLVAYALLASDFDFENRYIENGWSKHIT
ncbi:MAG: hypothetical protein KDB98_13725, partial [Flavobacteriales bacterium]|nr:hypothetical protein [Flavobacteriales bacterium]